jgi:hypothetical protein
MVNLIKFRPNWPPLQNLSLPLSLDWLIILALPPFEKTVLPEFPREKTCNLPVSSVCFYFNKTGFLQALLSRHHIFIIVAPK